MFGGTFGIPDNRRDRNILSRAHADFRRATKNAFPCGVVTRGALRQSLSARGGRRRIVARAVLGRRGGTLEDANGGLEGRCWWDDDARDGRPHPRGRHDDLRHRDLLVCVVPYPLVVFLLGRCFVPIIGDCARGCSSFMACGAGVSPDVLWFAREPL